MAAAFEPVASTPTAETFNKLFSSDAIGDSHAHAELTGMAFLAKKNSVGAELDLMRKIYDYTKSPTYRRAESDPSLGVTFPDRMKSLYKKYSEIKPDLPHSRELTSMDAVGWTGDKAKESVVKIEWSKAQSVLVKRLIDCDFWAKWDALERYFKGMTPLPMHSSLQLEITDLSRQKTVSIPQFVAILQGKSDIDRLVFNHDYDFILMSNGEVRYFDLHAYPEHGHSSMLHGSERSLPERDQVVMYAGEFIPDKNGKVMYFSNKSGHFRPSSKDFDQIVHDTFGISTKLRYLMKRPEFHAHGEHQNMMLMDESYGVLRPKSHHQRSRHDNDIDSGYTSGGYSGAHVADYDEGYDRLISGEYKYYDIDAHASVSESPLLIGGVFGASAVVVIMLIFCLGLAFGMVIYWGYSQKRALDVQTKK
eukprot:482886_1